MVYSLTGVRYRPDHICSGPAICTHCLRGTTQPCTHGWPCKGSPFPPSVLFHSSQCGAKWLLNLSKGTTEVEHQARKRFNFKVNFWKSQITLKFSKVRSFLHKDWLCLFLKILSLVCNFPFNLDVSLDCFGTRKRHPEGLRGENNEIIKCK